MPTGVPIDERYITDLWERQEFEAPTLLSLGLRVVARGFPSDAGGPDYQDVILCLNERDVLVGDLELHVRSSDWYRHGHHRDAHYNRVILHVVWIDDAGVTRRQDGATVRTLALGGPGMQAGTAPVTANAHLIPHPCVAPLSKVSGLALVDVVQSLGVARFFGRCDRFAAEMESLAPDQVAYLGLLEALGYASNRDTFRELGEAAPLSWLAELPATHVRTALLHAAGLGPPGPYEPPSRLAAGSWRLARLRPGNHPAVRIAGVAVLVARSRGNFANYLADVATGSATPARLRSALMCAEGKDAFIGRGRADELAASFVLPFVAAFTGERSSMAALFARYPSPPANRWTRTMCDIIRASGHTLRVARAPVHQGLHELYHRHCRYNRRTTCPVCRRYDAGD